jgi:hypothetical protein
MRAVKQRRMRKSAVVREALERYLDESVTAPQGAFLEMTRHLLGCVKDAPADLSSNARHLADFGK